MNEHYDLLALIVMKENIVVNTIFVFYEIVTYEKNNLNAVQIMR